MLSLNNYYYVVCIFDFRLLDFCICSFIIILYCSIVLYTNANNLTFKYSSTISVRTVSHKVTLRVSSSGKGATKALHAFMTWETAQM